MSLSPPKLSRDTRGYCNNKATPRKIVAEFENKSPKDLPGEGEKSISTQSFYPYEESLNSDNASSSKKEDKRTTLDEEIVSEKDEMSSNKTSDGASEQDDQNDSDIDSQNGRTLTPSEEEAEEIIKTIKSNDTFPTVQSSDSDEDIIVTEERERVKECREIEMFLKENKFSVQETYILTEKNGEMIYLVKLCSFFGTCFFIKFEEKIVIGEEKIFLNETEDEFDLVMFSPDYTKFLREAEAITIFNESIVYRGKVYGNGHEMLRTHNPSSHPVVSESVLESPFNPFDLAIKVHDMWVDIDYLYKRLLASSFNKLMDSMEDFSEDIENKRRILEEIDEENDEESESYDKIFVKKLEKDEFPSEQETHRMKFLRKVESKYSQAQFILWKRVHENLNAAKNEFEQSIMNIFIEMKKDFPEMDIEIDESIDVSRSYPGKIFLKEK